jgi:hypothetical protein
LINGYYFEVSPAYYVKVRNPEKTDGSYSCNIEFGRLDRNRWSLGVAFLKGYYSVWDDANSQLGIAPRVGSVVGEIVAGSAGKTKI